MFNKNNFKKIVLGLATILMGIGVTSQVASAKANPAYKLFSEGNYTVLDKNHKDGNPYLRLYLNKSGKKYYMVVTKFDTSGNEPLKYSTTLSKVRVTKALYKNKTYYFYSKTSSKAIPSKKIRKSGNYKYRLSVKNTGKIETKPFYNIESHEVIGRFYSKVYKINGSKYLFNYKTKQWGSA